jgi:serine/threonine-protein kinase
MAMEWVEGDSLRTIIKEARRRRAIPAEIAVKIIADAAAGLHAAHELRGWDGELRNIVHCDVSPHNILVGLDGRAKLVDFGVANATAHSDQGSEDKIKGKFGYMSPEQALGKQVDRRSDIFSLGIVLFELTTSRRLFRGETDIETLKLVISSRVPPPTSLDPHYPPELERIVMRALQRDPQARYQSAAELEGDLRQYLKSKRIVVAQSGIAGLLKRVIGERIEQRRRAVRSALRTRARGSFGDDLLSNEPVFTPTGGERISVTGASVPSRASGLSYSGVSSAGGSLPGVAPPSSRSVVSRGGSDPNRLIAIVAYSVGVAGILIAIAVLYLNGH